MNRKLSLFAALIAIFFAAATWAAAPPAAQGNVTKNCDSGQSVEPPVVSVIGTITKYTGTKTVAGLVSFIGPCSSTITPAWSLLLGRG
jgi:hypothetical protein